MTLVSRGYPVAMAAGIVMCLAKVASAQSAEAEALFRDGRALIKAGKLDAGCDKLEASERLESSVGTLLNLGDCREKQGRNASAWAAFRKAEATAKRAGDDAKRMLEAKRRADKLEGKLARLVITVDNRVDGLVVKRDDEVVDSAVWGTAVPVDPDTYKIVVEAPGYLPWRTEVNVDGKLKRKVVVVPPLVRATRPPIPPPTESPAGPAPVTQPPHSPVESAPLTSVPPEPVSRAVVTRDRGPWTNTRRGAVVVGVVGLGAIGGGVYFGMRSRDLQSKSDELCPLVTCTDVDGLRYNDDAQAAALRANILYAAGGIAVATAAVMWLVGGPDERTVIMPAVGDGQAGVSLSRSF